MADKVVELDERLNRLEEKLKLTFIEIEKRMTQQQPQETVDFGDRIDELEDLILLLQLENTKLREKVGEGLDFGISPTAPDISERLTRIESEISSRVNMVAEDVHDESVHARINELESKINSPIPEDHPIHQNVKELEKKVKTLEALLAKRGREELEVEESRLLDDVRNILKG